MHFVNTVVIRRPTTEVFGFVTDFENQHRWNYMVVGCTKDKPGPIGVGSSYSQVRKSDTQHFDVTEYEPYVAATMRFTVPRGGLEIRYRFETVEGGTRVTDEWFMGGIPGLIAGLIAPAQQAVAENLGKLKELLETGRTQLQDGRVERLVLATQVTEEED